jgi:hypothetical protein
VAGGKAHHPLFRLAAMIGWLMQIEWRLRSELKPVVAPLVKLL